MLPYPVLRMLSDYVEEARFLKGVSIYLQNKLYGNGTSKDLWEGISKATGLDIVSLMENWVTKVCASSMAPTTYETSIVCRLVFQFLLSLRRRPASKFDKTGFWRRGSLNQQKMKPSGAFLLLWISWCIFMSYKLRNVPLNILSVDSASQVRVDRTALLQERSQEFALDTSKPFKLNAGTAGVCESALSQVEYRNKRL